MLDYKNSRKHTVNLTEKVWKYICEQAKKNNLGTSELINKTFEYMIENNQEIRTEYHIHNKGE